jgi:hypothetical protein
MQLLEVGPIQGLDCFFYELLAGERNGQVTVNG